MMEPTTRRFASLQLTRAALVMLAGLSLAGSGAPVEAADVSTVTHGARVQLESHLVSGKLTLFDFYADWCSGCRQVEPIISRLASANGEALAVRKIDIVSWGSPVAKQFGLRSIPHLKLFDPDGRLLREGDPSTVLSVLQQRLGGVMPGGSAGQGLEGTGVSASRGGLVTFLIVAAVIIVAGVLIGTMKRRGMEDLEAEPEVRAEGAAAGAPPTGGRGLVGGDPDALPIWFAMIQDSLEGPFSVHDLEDLERRGGIATDARIRRKGESGWRSLDDVLRRD
jgi:thiol-disulfide isomerase/thioredoxin